MNAALTISFEGLYASDIKPIRKAIGRAMRNKEIRALYAELMPKVGSEQAILQLADDYELSDRQIRSILYGHQK